MIDRRELILSRLNVLLEEVPGVVKTGRNMEDVSGKSRPAILLHDGVEETADLGGRPKKATRDLVTLSPQIFILLGGRAQEVGTKIAEFRNALIGLIWKDAQLLETVGAQGDIRYTGCGLESSSGENREARLEVKFEFTYMVDAAELMG